MHSLEGNRYADIVGCHGRISADSLSTKLVVLQKSAVGDEVVTAQVHHEVVDSGLLAFASIEVLF